jgi:hypothetical protein
VLLAFGIVVVLKETQANHTSSRAGEEIASRDIA